MLKTLSLIIALLLMPTVSFADGFPYGATFVKLFNKGTIDADRSTGSATATFAASRDATHPATYIDVDGVMQKTTTANAPRYNYGYYDTSGYTAFATSGVMVESASTNLITYSMGLDDGDWTSANSSVVANDIVSPDGTVNADKITTTDADTHRFYQDPTVVAETTYTFSFFVKAGTQTAWKYAIYDVDNSDWITEGTAYTAYTTKWVRITHSFTTPVGCTSINAYALRNSGSAGTTYIWGAQLEASPFATSFIPTTTASLTRNAETLKYPIASNRTAAVESCVVKVAPEYTHDTANSKYITAADTKRRIFLFRDAANDVWMYPNLTDSSDSKVDDIINASWAANAEITLGYAIQSTGNPNVAGFYNGVADGTNADTDFTAPAWGTYFWVGTDKDGASQLNGTIFSIAFWSRVLTADEMLWAHSNRWYDRKRVI